MKSAFYEGYHLRCTLLATNFIDDTQKTSEIYTPIYISLSLNISINTQRKNPLQKRTTDYINSYANREGATFIIPRNQHHEPTLLMLVLKS